MKILTLCAVVVAAGAGAPAAIPALWLAEDPVPTAAALSPIEGVEIHVIKRHEPALDGGYGFLHGVALAWHKGQLYASFGHNKGKENTSTEEARGRVSQDGGRTWGEFFTIDAGDPANELAVSHGVFHSQGGELWAFMGAFHGNRKNVHTRAYLLDERTKRWTFRGVVVEGGFWPMQQPLKLANGNWIMAGFQVDENNRAAVALSRGGDLLHWDLVVIPKPPELKMWGESTVIVDAKRVLNIARFGAEAQALVAVSEDSGRTWTESLPGNLPMVTSKPYAGTLSTGQPYLVCTTTSDTGKRRAPLTIAVGRPGEAGFRRVFRIRDAELADAPGDSHPRASLSYPYAIEHDGRLYVGYSNNGGRTGMNINSAELAVIPIAALRVP